MTAKEVAILRKISFENYCTCGGFARQVPVSNPHTSWCPQVKEYGEWFEIVQKHKNRDLPIGI